MIAPLFDNSFLLLPQKACFWQEQSILLIADLHLGKVNHFRRSGIPVPVEANDENTERLIDLLQKMKPERVMFMGDLFHSHYNHEWEVFGQILKAFPAVSFELVIGNHDIMSEYQYKKNNLVIHKEPLLIDQFILSHEPLEANNSSAYNLAGHIHPGVRLKGKGRQGITLPCFYFGEHQGLLPAFGQFTGTAKISPKENDRVYVIVENEVLNLSKGIIK